MIQGNRILRGKEVLCYDGKNSHISQEDDMSSGRVRTFVPIEDKELLAYMAGIIDVMGSFSITHKRSSGGKCWGCRISICSTDERVINFFNQSFRMSRGDEKIEIVGENKHTKKYIVRAGHLISRVHYWRAAGKLLRYIINSCSHLFRLKKDHIEIFNTFIGTMRESAHKIPLTDEDIEIRLKCLQDLSVINKKNRPRRILKEEH
jgi:hypothetical protein